MAMSTSVSHTMSNLYFLTVDAGCPALFKVIEKIFNERVSQWLGSQSTNLAAIAEGKDRLCEVLMDKENPKALIVYRKTLVRQHLPVDFFGLVDPSQSRQGLGSRLIERCIQIAQARAAYGIAIKGFSDDVSGKNFFTKKEFKIVQENSCLKPDVKELVWLHTFATEGAPPAAKRLCVATEDSSTSRVAVATVREQYSSTTALGSSSGSITRPASFAGKTFGCTLKMQYIRLIQSGRKTYEGRINSGPFLQYKVGDQVRWFAGTEGVLTEITTVQRFAGFKQMLETVGYEKMIPEARSLQDAINAYVAIPGYQDRAQRCGVVAFGLRVIAEDKASLKRTERS